MEDNAPSQPEQIVITTDKIEDPYEEGNRSRFETHVALHSVVIDPVESAYINAVPALVRAGVHNFLTNLESPSVFANNLFQGEPYNAGGTLSRFAINSTIGIGGVFDVATGMGFRYRDDDFGRTLATYGVSDCPYLLVPVIGPTNPRDLSGKVIDFFLNPLRYFTLPGGFMTSVGHAGLHEVDKRSEDVGQLDTLARTALDPYASERTMARERRNSEIHGHPSE
jgi:phospholipid-binding lipoprotein MlaA